MINDVVHQAKSSISSSVGSQESAVFHPYGGEIFWSLVDEDGSVVQSGHRKNIVTRDASILLAWLMANKGGPNVGIKYLAVGSGDPSWDPMNPPPASRDQRSLYTEIGRVAFASTAFLNGTSDSGVPTNVVDFSFLFTASQAVGPIVEMGLIGGDCNTNDAAVRNPILPPNSQYDPTVDVSGKDILCNYITFPVVNKGPTQTLNYTWRLTF